MCCGKEPGHENERSLEQRKGIPSVAEVDSYVHHAVLCCLVIIRVNLFFFFNWKAHLFKNQNFTGKVTLMYLSVSPQLKEVLQFLKTFGLVFQFKKTDHFRK